MVYIYEITGKRRMFQGLRKTVNAFTQLEPGWDGYSGKPVCKELAMEALCVAREFLLLAPAVTNARAVTGNGLQVTLEFEIDLIRVAVEVDVDDLNTTVPEYVALITRSSKGVASGVAWGDDRADVFKVASSHSLRELYLLAIAANKELRQRLPRRSVRATVKEWLIRWTARL